MLALHDAGIDRFVDVGPGKVLARLGKRILPDGQGRDPRGARPCVAPRSRPTCARSPARRPGTASRRSPRAAHHHRPGPLRPGRGRAERRDRRAHRRRRRAGSSSAPACATRRRAAPGRAPQRHGHVRPPARALADAGVDAADLDLVLVATMSQDEIMPNAAPLVAHALGAERAGAIDIGAACSGFLAALRLGRRPDRDRPRRPRPRDRRRGADPARSTSTTRRPRTCSATAPARSCSAPTAPARIGPIMLAADGSLGPAITCSYDGPRDRHGRPLDLPDGRQAPVRGHRRRRRARRPRARRHRPVRLPPGQRRASSAPSASASDLEPGQGRRLRRAHGQHVRGLDPAHAAPAARGQPPARRHRRCCSPPSAPASPGAPASSNGGIA